jgi:carboxyl-terminal processing protease
MTHSQRRFVGWLIVAVALAAIGAALLVPRAPARGADLPAGALAPNANQRKVAREVGEILTHYQYSDPDINAHFSELVLARYLHYLDPERSYFLAADVRGFKARYGADFAQLLEAGKLGPAFLIFQRFRQLSRERLHYALGLLAREPDFNTHATFDLDRKHAPWPASAAQMDALWHKRVMNDAIALMLSGKSWPQAAGTLRKRFTAELRSIDQISAEDVFQEVMNAYARTFDPHTTYFSPLNSEEYNIEMSLNYQGIGASLEMDGNYVKVINVIPGGPAAISGKLKPGDRITGIGEGKHGPITDVVGWRLGKVVQLIRGKAGTTVRLEILPAGAQPGSKETVLSLVRNRVTLKAQEAHGKLETVKQDGHVYKIGVITVPSFYEDVRAEDDGDNHYPSTTRDVRRLILKFEKQHMQGLLLNLRNDGGGYLPQATALTGLFIPHGPVVQLRGRSGHIEVLNDPERAPIYTGPLAVLVNRYSASASEIFAGAIQDYHRGVIIGQNTWGKGTVQNLIPLEWHHGRATGGEIAVTIGKFYRITGQSTQLRGVIPNIKLPSPINPHTVGESSLPRALPYNTIGPVPFKLCTGTAAIPSIATLKAEERARERHDPNFRWLVAEIHAIRSMRAQKVVSLNLAVRRREQHEQDQELLALDNLRRHALGLAPLKKFKQIGGKTDKIPDVILDQAKDIVADMVRLVEPARQRQGLARRS